MNNTHNSMQHTFSPLSERELEYVQGSKGVVETLVVVAVAIAQVIIAVDRANQIK